VTDNFTMASLPYCTHFIGPSYTDITTYESYTVGCHWL